MSKKENDELKNEEQDAFAGDVSGEKVTGNKMISEESPTQEAMAPEDEKIAASGVPLDPDSREAIEKRFLRNILLGFSGLVVLFFIIFAAAFFISIRGAEPALVPDLVGKELQESLIALQERELYPRIQVKFTENPQDKGMVMEQNPVSGTIVKAGRRVNLTVSKGAVVDRVGDYVGQNLTDVKIHLQTLFATYKPLLQIKNPVIYVYDETPAGTIITQRPTADTRIAGLTDLHLVVSRGPADEEFPVEDYVGSYFEEIMRLLAYQNQPFEFILTDENINGKEAGEIVAQEPEAGENMKITDPVKLTIASPERVSESLILGILEFTLPAYPVYVDLTLEKVIPGQDSELIFKTKSNGGPMSIPFYDEKGAILVVSVEGREEMRYEIQPKKEE